MSLQNYAEKTRWSKIFSHPKNKEDNKKLFGKIESLYKDVEDEVSEREIFPPINLVFKAFDFFEPLETKVVIIGQDPYIRQGQAMGLSFSVPKNTAAPPSLKNIFKELQRTGEEIARSTDMKRQKTMGFYRRKTKDLRKNPDLSDWARQGVLLLNRVLTVQEGKSNSHKDKGWEDLTLKLIKFLDKYGKNLVFLLWGRCAQSIGYVINPEKHLVLEHSHPSPMGFKSTSAPLWGSGCFETCNIYLEKNGKKPIQWTM